ncbi:MAG: LytR C-terminal domain-containing protein [Candidatus Zixiibacteriota bacterium]
MKREKTFKIIGVGIGSVLLVVMLYLFSSTAQVVGGITKVVNTPKYLVRLQIVNGSSVDGLAQQMADQLAGHVDSDLEIKVVDLAEFKLRKLAKSFVISREQDKTAAKILAKEINLDPADVEFKPLEHNYRQVSATLVLGEDYKIIRLSRTQTEEK